VSAHTGTWSLDPASHALEWAVALITPGDSSGALEFTVGGDDVASFFPVKVSFVGQGSLAGLHVESARHVGSGEEAVFSQDAILKTDEYLLV
jgi:coatomer subunit delta